MSCTESVGSIDDGNRDDVGPSNRVAKKEIASLEVAAKSVMVPLVLDDPIASAEVKFDPGVARANFMKYLDELGVGAKIRRARLKKPKRIKRDDLPLGSSHSTKFTLATLREAFEISNDIDLIVPSIYDLPEFPQTGCFTLYESFFYDCLLWLPIPEILIRFVRRHGLAFSQITTRGLRHLVGILVRSYECGIDLEIDHFENFLCWRRGPKKKLYYYCSNRPDRRIITDFPSKDSDRW